MAKLKHDHKGTKKLKVILFGIVMLMPFLAVIPNILYYAFNEHATDSNTATINYKYETNEVNSEEDLIDGNAYVIDLHLNYGIDMYSLTYKNVEGKLQVLYNPLPNGQYYNFYRGNENYVAGSIRNKYGQYVANVDTMYYQNIVEMYGIFRNIDYYEGATFSELPNEYNFIESVTYEQKDIKQSLADTWHYTWTENKAFSWVNNCPLYNPLNSFVNVFNISQETGITQMLTYWATITAVYVVFDIIIELFTFISHQINKEKD